jgi:O-antigen/teichoic acid export membrane protein
MTTTSSRDDLGATAARAIAWNYLSFASGKVLVLVTMAVLARLLTPEEFGIVGFATLVTAYLAVLKDLGLGAAVIQRQDDVEESAQTVFVLNLAIGATLTAITFAVAPAVAAFFREPLVTPLLRVLGFTFVLESLGSMHVVLLKRNLDFRRKLVPDVGQSIVKGVVAISTAATGFGVWALVWGHLAGVLAFVVLSWAVIPWRPTWRVHRRLIRPLSRFGAPLLVTDIQYAVWSNLDYVVVGRMLGDAALGVYTLAYRLPELLVHSVWRVLAQAVFPVFSRLQDDLAALRRGFLATIRYTQLAIVPLCVGLFVTAEPAVAVLFGDQWSAVVPVLQVMAVFSLVGSIGVNVGDVYKALGRPGILAKLSALELAMLVPALLYGARYGVVGVAWAHAAVASVDSTVRLLVARHVLALPLRDIGRQLAPSFVAGAALAVSSWTTLRLSAGVGSLGSLLLATVVGAVTYAVAVWHLDRTAVRKVLGWIGMRKVREA